MIDYYALLQLPRLPYLDEEELKQHFLELSSPLHPDRFSQASQAEQQAANERYAELNAAYNCLREPRKRLLHLIELERQSKPPDIQRIPPGTMDLFVEVGQTCRQVDEFLAERSKADSPMLKARLFQAGLEWADKLQTLHQRVNARKKELNDELRAMNDSWIKAPPIGDKERLASLPLERLEQIYRIYSYISRWEEQIQERLVQLTLT